MKTGSLQSLQKIQSWGTSWQQLASAWAQTLNSRRALLTNGSVSGLDQVRHAEYLPHYWAVRISTTVSRRPRLIRRAYRVCCCLSVPKPPPLSHLAGRQV